MKLQEWKRLFPQAWQKEYEYLQIGRLVKIGECNYTIRTCKKSTYIERTPEVEPSWLT